MNSSRDLRTVTVEYKYTPYSKNEIEATVVNIDFADISDFESFVRFIDGIDHEFDARDDSNPQANRYGARLFCTSSMIQNKQYASVILDFFAQK